jgi:hypothetical protein
MESKEGCLGWGLRGVEYVGGRGKLFSRRLCPRVFAFWKRGHDGGDERRDRHTEGREEGTLTGVQGLGLGQAEAKQPEQGDGSVRRVRTTMQITQPVKTLDR